MKILLLRDIKKIGKRHEVKEVSDGFARNFLIPQKKAIPADQKALQIKLDFEKKESELTEKYRCLAQKLKNEVLEFAVKTGSKGEVFGSITSGNIKQSLREKGFGEVEILPNQPLRSIGEHQIKVNFGRGVRGVATIKLYSQP